MRGKDARSRRPSRPVPALQYLTLLLRNLGVPFLNDRYGVALAGDDFTARDISVYSERDGIASIGSNGEIYCRVRWEQTADTQFLLYAGGSELDGIYPHVEFKLDGEVRAEIDLEGPSIVPYRIGPFPVTAVDHEIAVRFTNDAYDPPADRNLKVARVLLQLPTTE